MARTTYKVVGGDTLWAIAQANNTTVDKLIELNPRYKKNPNVIRVGETVVLPTKKGTTTNWATDFFDSVQKSEWEKAFKEAELQQQPNQTGELDTSPTPSLEEPVPMPMPTPTRPRPMETKPPNWDPQAQPGLWVPKNPKFSGTTWTNTETGETWSPGSQEGGGTIDLPTWGAPQEPDVDYSVDDLDKPTPPPQYQAVSYTHLTLPTIYSV